MRRRLLCAVAIILLLPETGALSLEVSVDDDAPWSWQDGLLGDSTEGDVYGDDDGTYPGYLCYGCRDPDVFPIDYAAFAYNGFWGDDAWMLGSRLGIPFRIYNRAGDWVVVWFENYLFDSLSLLPATLDIRIRLRNGAILTITVLQGGPDMPVGDPNPDQSIGTGSGGGGDDGDDYDDYDDGNELIHEESDSIGNVEVVDPDDDGDYPEWIEEL